MRALLSRTPSVALQSIATKSRRSAHIMSCIQEKRVPSSYHSATSAKWHLPRAARVLKKLQWWSIHHGGAIAHVIFQTKNFASTVYKIGSQLQLNTLVLFCSLQQANGVEDSVHLVRSHLEQQYVCEACSVLRICSVTYWNLHWGQILFKVFNYR